MYVFTLPWIIYSITGTRSSAQVLTLQAETITMILLLGYYYYTTRLGVVVTSFVALPKLLYIEPG